METLPIQDEDHFVELIDHSEENDLNEGQAEVLWEIWREEGDGRLLIKIPEWKSMEELDRKRPFILGNIEFDEPDKGAVLFSDVETVNISVVKNEALTDIENSDDVERNLTNDVDLTDQEYYDEEGLIWVPRSGMEVYEQ